VDAPSATLTSAPGGSGCHNRRVKIDKLTSTNAFVVTDLDGASQAAGVVRAAPKVLQGSTKAMARTMTYAFAVRELQISGAAAGISAEADTRDEAIAAFVEELAPRVEDGSLVLDPGNGVSAEALSALADPRDPVRNEDVDGLSLHAHLEALGPIVAAEAALGGLDGRTAAVESSPVSGRMVAELVRRGVTVVAFGDAKGAAVDPGGLDTDALIAGAPLDQVTTDVQPAMALLAAEASVLFCGSRQGLIDGTVAETTGASLIVPTGSHALGAKGLAVLRRREVVALADFVTASASTYAGWPAGTATVAAVIADATAGITELVTDSLGHAEGPVLGACYRAEAYLGTWQDSLPFGRPLG
jgi:glutamate dehydrogenase (NAD(P)+)